MKLIDNVLQKDKLSTKIKFQREDILIIVILLVGILVRIVGITGMPNALNCDEASSGYEAFSILNYGIDRTGNKLPSFLVSWGGGQNVLLTYLIIPFIKIFGLNILAIRLPMTILGCISLYIMYALLKKISNKKVAIVGLAFLSICPWHIMKSRWGLESNLFPDLILIFVYLLIKGIEDKNKFIYYLAFIIAGVSAYSYGTSYYFLPVFIIPLLIILVKKQKITIKQAIISICIIGIVALPVILYVIINTFDLPQINLPFVTIPKLDVNRYKELTSIFSGEFLKSSESNFIESIKILIKQTDALPWNSIEPYGIIYPFSILFTIMGIMNGFKKNKIIEVKYNYIFNIWFIVSIFLTFICEPNINRLNIIMLPIIYYTIIGIYIILDNIKKSSIIISIIYIATFALFVNKYMHQDCNNYETFEADLEEVVQYIDKIQDKEIHITNKIQSSYIYVLFYTQYDTTEFIKSVNYEDLFVEFRNVKSFGKFYFENVENMDFQKGNIYVIKKEEKDNFNFENTNVKEFKRYIVVEK